MNSTSRTPWLISFGDLLTLVLCFFIATVSFQNPSNQLEVQDKPARTPLGSHNGMGVAQLGDEKANGSVDSSFVEKSVKKLTLNSLPRTSNEWGMQFSSPPQEVSLTACSLVAEGEDDGVFIALLGVSVEALKSYGVKKINIREGCFEQKSLVVYG